MVSRADPVAVADCYDEMRRMARRLLVSAGDRLLLQPTELAQEASPTEEDARPRRRALPLPDRIGAYRLSGKLREGGMGLVFAGTRADGLSDWAPARQRWNLGTTLISLNRAAAALPLLRAAEATLTRISAEGPDDVIAARRLRSYDLATAQALAALGRTEEAVDLLAANIAARRRWAAASPGDAGRPRDVAVAEAALGDVHAGAGQTPAACARYAEVNRLHAALARARRLSRFDSGCSAD